jgi:hypothetical protein
VDVRDSGGAGGKKKLQLNTTCRGQLPTEHYRPGAIGVPAGGYGLKTGSDIDGLHPSFSVACTGGGSLWGGSVDTSEVIFG